MVRAWPRIVVVVLCAAALALPAVGVLADPERDLDDVRERRQETQETIEDIDRRRDVTLEDLQRIDLELSELDARLAALQAELGGAQAELEEAEARLARTTTELIATERRLDETRAQLNAERKVFTDRTRASFMYGGPMNLAGSMLDAGDVGQFGRALVYVERVMANDRDRVTRVAGLVRETEADTVELGMLQDKEAEQRTAAEAERNRVAGLVEQERALREQVVARRDERQATLNALEDDRDRHLEIAAALEAESQRLEEELRRRAEEERRRREAAARASSGSAATAPASSGQLQMPVSGRMSSGYGWRTHPIFGSRRFHAGLDFGAPHGTPIYAAESGVVVTASPRGGYGLTVIIDHGSGMTTLYAHQSRFAVSAGQQVQRGQLIGYVGSTGFSTGPHLHFEVRINGATRDPRGYL
jgi:murein DD-endopeptidase MepM/ murein hydrolase activator NlpD